MTQHTCLWWETAPRPKSYTGKPLPQRTDIIVIGGGFTGASAALQLAKHGARVALLEAKTIGYEASSRNGGQALSCLHYTLTEIIKQHGRGLAKEMFLAAVEAANTVERIVKEENIDCDYVRCGSIEAASKPAHFEKLKREQETLHEVVNFDSQIFSKDAVRAELGTDAYHGLLVNPREGSVQPAKFVRGMAEAAERAGADIYEGVRVLAVERVQGSMDGTRFKVQTEAGEIAAKDILVAASAWAGKLIPQFRFKVFPGESYVIATEPLSDELAERLIPNNRVAYDTRHILAYYRLSPEKRMVWGGELTMRGASPQMNIRALRKGMARIFPELANTKLDYFWSGTLALTMDETAHAGQTPDGIWYSMAYVGHGVTLATYLGMQMANGILGKPINNPFADLNIPHRRIGTAPGLLTSENFGIVFWIRLHNLSQARGKIANCQTAISKIPIINSPYAVARDLSRGFRRHECRGTNELRNVSY
ncbi:MAG: FAD-binding oxidoreductase [Anaerolineales bacterium]